MSTLGFIGVGAMGTPMAQNLLAAGHTLTVFARRPGATDTLRAAGAGVADSPAALASSCDVVITMVTDAAAVGDVLMAPNGIVHAARAGLIVIDHSTIAPEATKRFAHELRARGISMLDAPVSGGVGAAASATLSIMVGGDPDVYEQCLPILKAVGRTITYIGDSGAGQIAKACNQICTIVNQEGAAEAMALAERAGVDPLRVKEALMAGFAASRMLELQAPKMAARDFAPRPGNVESRLHHKDIQIVLEMARALGLDLPASAAAAGPLAQLQAEGGAHHDSAEIFRILQTRR